MKIGTAVRNMGPAATAECMLHCARAAEAAGLDHVWTVDHIAIPIDTTNRDGKILFLDLAIVKLLRQMHVHGVGLGHHDYAARVAVQPMNDARSCRPADIR